MSRASHELTVRESTSNSVTARRASTFQAEISQETRRRANSRAFNVEDSQQLPEFTLPPTDQGKDAWLLLAATFFIEALVWGIPFTFGLFQEYYSTLPEFENERSSVATIGTVALGVLYLGSPFCLLGLRQWPQYRRRSIVVGTCIVVASLLMASFATTVWQLVLTQGLLSSIGGSMLYYPLLLFMDEWFVRRKGMAFGIAWAGTGASGLAFPFFVSWSLHRYSFRTTLRIVAVCYIAVVVPAFFFLKPRLPVALSSRRGFPNVRFALKRPFLPCQIGNILESLGFFMPGIFLPTYTVYVGHSGTIATATIVLLNCGTFVGCLSFGFLVDRWNIAHVTLLSTIGATLSVVLLWGLSGSAALLCIFAFLYGFFGGGFSATWPGVVQEATRRNPQIETGLAYAMLVAGRGIGSVVSGPLSNALLQLQPLSRDFLYGYGSKYGWLIVFAGISNAMGSTAFIARRLGWW